MKTLLESPIGRHRDVFLYALLLVMSRLGAPWQLIRLAIQAAGSDAAARIAETPFAVAVEIVLTDVARMIAALRDSVKAGRGAEVAGHLKDVHDAVRGLRTELDFSSDSGWSRQLAAFRSEVSKLLQAEIENLPGQVRRVLRPRPAKETGPMRRSTQATSTRSRQARARREPAATIRRARLQRGDAAVHSDLQNYFDSGTQVLIDRLRTSPPAERSFRQSQVDAAVRFCATLFGADSPARRQGRAVAAKAPESGRERRSIEARRRSPELRHAATLIVPALLSTITGECRYSIVGGVPYLPSTKARHSAV